MLKRIREWLTLTPLGKTFAFFVSVILSGVFSGALVTEITVDGELDWSIIYKTKSFYALIILIVAVYIYNQLLYKEEQNVRNYMDNDYCKAYIRHKALPELAKKYEKIISDENNIKNLSEWKDELTRMLEEK